MSLLRRCVSAAAGLAAGVLIAILILIGLGTRTPARPHPGHGPGPWLSEWEGSIATVAMHWVPEQHSLVMEAYTDFLGALAPGTAVVWVIPATTTAGDRTRLEQFMDAVDASGALRASSRVVTNDGPLTTWSKDRALVAAPSSPNAPGWLLAPSEPGRSWATRHGDWLSVPALARASDGRLEAHVAPFDFDAGDFLVDDGRLVIDSNLVLKNRRFGVNTAGELRHRLASYLGAPVVVWGEEPGDTPNHHLAMIATPGGAATMLVGDPQLAREVLGDGYVPGEVSVETGRPLVADFSAVTQSRFDRVARDAERSGWRVVRIPNVPFDDKTYISYTNGVFETRGAARHAHLPVYSEPELDRRAIEVWQRLGWTVHPVRARRLYPHHGTIGCLVNVLRREPAGSPLARRAALRGS